MARAAARPASPQFDRIAATCAALVIIGLTVFLLIRNEKIADPQLFFALRLVLSLSAAILGATIPGFLELSWSGRGAAIRAGGALALFVLTFLFTPDLVKEPKQEGHGGANVTAPQSVAIGRDAINSPITIGLNEEGVRRILREEIPELARTKDIPEAPLRAVLERLGEKGVPLADIPARLAAAADELVRLRADLARLRNDRPEFAAIRARASALIDQGELDAARAVLREGREAARALREEVSRSEASFLADEARINRLQLNSDAAIENLTEASQLDPGNTWVWIDLGDLWLERGSLVEADKAYTAALKAAIASGDERDQMVAQSKIADVRIRQGDRPAALAAYKLVLKINETLSRRDPGNTEWQRDLSVSQNRIGDVLAAEGDREAALQAYRAGLAIRETLSRRDPGNTGWQRDLSVSHERIGDVLVAEGDREGALAACRAGLAIAETLSRRDPGYTLWQRDLIVSCWKIAEADPKAAPALLKRALEIATQLQASGKLAPVDAWIPAELARLLAQHRAGK